LFLGFSKLSEMDFPAHTDGAMPKIKLYQLCRQICLRGIEGF
jgi:hypothetical protein